MLRKFLILVFIFALIWANYHKEQESNYLDQITPLQIVPNNEAQQILEKVNAKNKTISSLHFKSIKVQTFWRINSHIKAELWYQKDKNFRLIVKSIYGKEGDLGSNNNLFWFWSKRMDNILYYSEHKNLGKCGLRAPFHPLWLMECLGFTDIKGKITKCEDGYLFVEEERMSTEGVAVTKGTLIKDDLVVGHYLFKNNHLIASVEIEEFNVVPKKMVIHWYEENLTMIWNIEDYEVNPEISDKIWQKPSFKHEENIGE